MPAVIIIAKQGQSHYHIVSVYLTHSLYPRASCIDISHVYVPTCAIQQHVCVVSTAEY